MVIKGNAQDAGYADDRKLTVHVEELVDPSPVRETETALGPRFLREPSASVIRSLEASTGRGEDTSELRTAEAAHESVFHPSVNDPVSGEPGGRDRTNDWLTESVAEPGSGFLNSPNPSVKVPSRKLSSSSVKIPFRFKSRMTAFTGGRADSTIVMVCTSRHPKLSHVERSDVGTAAATE